MSKRSLFFLSLLLALATASTVKGEVGMGISHYDTSNITITADEPIKITVAKIWNTGNETLNVSSIWVPRNENETGLEVEVQPSSRVLKPERNFKLYIQLNQSDPGEYQGVVEIKGHTIADEKGNPVVGGQSLTVNIQVTPKPREAGSNLWMAAASTAVIASVLASLVAFFLKRRSRRAHPTAHPE